MSVKPGLYRHFHGSYYDVLGIAERYDYGTRFVIYRNMHGHMYARTEEEFLEPVDGSQVPRFEWIGDRDYPPPADPEMVKAAHEAFDRGDYLTSEEYTTELRQKINRPSWRMLFFVIALSACGWILATYLATKLSRLQKIIEQQPEPVRISGVTGKPL